MRKLHKSLTRPHITHILYPMVHRQTHFLHPPRISQKCLRKCEKKEAVSRWNGSRQLRTIFHASKLPSPIHHTLIDKPCDLNYHTHTHTSNEYLPILEHFSIIWKKWYSSIVAHHTTQVEKSQWVRSNWRFAYERWICISSKSSTIPYIRNTRYKDCPQFAPAMRGAG